MNKLFCILLLLPLAVPGMAASKTFWSTTFNSGIPAEITGPGRVESIQGFSIHSGFDGLFLRNDSLGQPTTLTLSGLPLHTHLSIRFSLAIIDTWDGSFPGGEDHFQVWLDGQPIFNETLGWYQPSFQPDEGVLLGFGTSLGWQAQHGEWAYDMGLQHQFRQIPHSANSVTIAFRAAGAGWHGGPDESWAIDNLKIELALVGAPEIVGLQAVSPVPPGQDVEVRASATGSQTLQFRWERSFDGGRKWEALVEGDGISGTESATLSVRMQSDTVNHLIRVRVSNCVGEIVSEAVLVGVLRAPEFQDQPNDVSVWEGDPLTLSALVTESDVVEFQWFKGESPVPGGTAARLVIPSAGFADAGAYRIMATNASGGAISEFARLRVQPKPQLSDLPPERVAEWFRAGLQMDRLPLGGRLVNFVELGGDPTGVQDNAMLLRQTIANLDSPTVIHFPPGTYRFGSSILIEQNANRPPLVLRGSGSHLTRFNFFAGAMPWNGLFEVRGSFAGAGHDVVRPLSQGSHRLGVASTDPFKPGDQVMLSQANDMGVMTSADTSPGFASLYRDSLKTWAARTVGQMFQVSAIDGNDLLLDRPARLTFSGAEPEVRRLNLCDWVGFEDFLIENHSSDQVVFNFKFELAANCWIKGVHSRMAANSHVLLTQTRNSLVTGCYFEDAHLHGGGGQGYGVDMINRSGDNLVSNNLFRRLRHSMLVHLGANGNVFAYNHSREVHPADSPDRLADISVHGHYPFMNLFEGNAVERIRCVDWWGPAGPGNTFLRNRITLVGLELRDRSHRQNVLGNEFLVAQGGLISTDGTSLDVLINGNNLSGQVQWAGATAEGLPISLFTHDPPLFVSPEEPWPWIGWPRALNEGLIPAQVRWIENNPTAMIPAVVPDLGDTDSDGMPDWMEVIAGTDPLSASALPELDPPTLGEGSVTVSWKSVAGRIYRIQSATSIEGPFQTHADHYATGPESSFTVEASPNGHYYIRFIVR